jgi:hypothetical protein
MRVLRGFDTTKESILEITFLKLVKWKREHFQENFFILYEEGEEDWIVETNSSEIQTGEDYILLSGLSSEREKNIMYVSRSDPFSNTDLCLLSHNNITDYFKLLPPTQPTNQPLIPTTKTFFTPVNKITNSLTIYFMCWKYCTHESVANNHYQTFCMRDILSQDRLCGLVVRVSGYRSRGPGFDYLLFHIFWKAADLERGPLSLVRTTEELLGRKSSGSGHENRD